MRQIGRFQTRVATGRAMSLRALHGEGALAEANLQLIQAVRAGDQAEMNLLCEACLILLRMGGTPAAIGAVPRIVPPSSARRP